MKRLLPLLLFLLPMGLFAQGSTPWYGTGIADDSIGTREFWYPGWSRVTTLPLLRWIIPGSSIISRQGAIIYLKKNGRTADTVIIEQRIIHRPETRDLVTGTWIKGDTSWQATTYMNMQTGALDTTGTVILNRPLFKLQVYDLSSSAMIRLRTTTLRPSAERVTYSVY